MKIVTVTVFVDVPDPDIDVQVRVVKKVIQEGIHPALVAACKVSKLPLEELTGPTRTENVVNHRRAAIAIMKEVDNLCYTDISSRVGFSDHTTAMYNHRKHMELIRTWVKYRKIYEKVLKKYEEITQV